MPKKVGISMRISLTLLLSFWALKGLASLQVGDVILQPLNCRLCRLIEAQEQSTFSHMSVVIKTTPQVLVAEAWGQVRMVPVEDFIKKGDLTRAHSVVRLKERKKMNLELAMKQWLGYPYDDQFLWNNVDELGREPVYCSEFVTKLLNPFLVNKIPTKYMDFSVNREAWWTYFHGDVPDGQPGNSPGDFARSPLFETVGAYKDGAWIWN